MSKEQPTPYGNDQIAPARFRFYVQGEVLEAWAPEELSIFQGAWLSTLSQQEAEASNALRESPENDGDAAMLRHLRASLLREILVNPRDDLVDTLTDTEYSLIVSAVFRAVSEYNRQWASDDGEPDAGEPDDDTTPGAPPDYGPTIARLLRFYSGGRPTDWIHTPVPLVRSMMGSIGRLRAEESMHQRIVYAMGAGNVEKKDAARILMDWQRQATAPGLSRAAAYTPEEKMQATQRLVSSIFGGLPPPPEEGGIARVGIDIKGLN